MPFVRLHKVLCISGSGAAGRRRCPGGLAVVLVLLCWGTTVLEVGARSNDTVGRLGLQRTATVFSTSLGDSGAVHRQKKMQTTTWLAGMMAEAM